MNKTLSQRFQEKVAKKPNGGCWEYTAFRNPKGYGMFKVAGRQLMAHRVSYELFVGEIPKGLLCLHRCDNPPCVNPKHLFLGTNQDNMNDMKAKGRNHPGAKSWMSILSVDEVKEMRRKYSIGFTITNIARFHNASRTNVHSIVNNRTWVGV